VKEEVEEKFTPEEIEKSIEEIKKEKGLDIIDFEVNKEGWVSFKNAEKIDQILEILKHPNNKVKKD
jgi:hypothetical protein